MLRRSLLRDAGSAARLPDDPQGRATSPTSSAPPHAVDVASRAAGLARDVPLHALIETHGALRDVERIAAHPRLESLSFGLMDFVSAHRGAIPQSAMGAEGQFTHPLVVRAKLAIAAACHGHAQDAVALRRDRVQGHAPACSAPPSARAASSATRACGASIPTRSA